jgi:hypothetical protein
MSIVQGQTTSFKVQLYQGTHNFLTNNFYIALYTGNANLNQATTAYASTNEVATSGGYAAGGKLLTGVTVNSDSASGVAYINFSNAVWSSVAFTARCALIYNASASNASVAVIDFGSDKTCASTFTVVMPVNTSSSALIRSS